MQRAEKLVVHLFESHEYLQDELKTLARSQVLMSDQVDRMAKRVDGLAHTLQEHIAHTDERFSETTDKLNALIGLMDQHLNEHREKRA